jgi:hypothetical protein
MKLVSSRELKVLIEENVTQEQIFAYYLKVDVQEIYSCLSKSNYKISNPLRVDNNPSVDFKYKNGKLRMIDYGSSQFSGDCYYVAGLVLRKNCNNGKDFVYILKDILNNISDIKENIIVSEIVKRKFQSESNKQKSLKIHMREWELNDLKYFLPIGLTPMWIRRGKIIPILGYEFDNKINSYEHDPSNPAYAYYLGKTGDTLKFKIKFPERKKGDRFPRFITNSKDDIECFHEIKDNTFLIISKSRNDTLLLRRIFEELGIDDVEVTNISGENARLTSKTYKAIKYSFNKIFTCFDIDKAGISNMVEFKNNYGFYPLPFVDKVLVNNGKLIKDPTDYCREYGYEQIKSLIYTLYINRISYNL